jgi:hypothetical protein
MTRTCPRCRVEQPLDRSHYYRRSRDRFGFQRLCIRCTRQDLDRADAARQQARQEARAEALRAEQAAAVGGPFGYYPPPPPYDLDENDEAREEHRQACLEWLIHRRADCVVAALDEAAWDGAASPFDVLTDALFDEAPEEDPEDCMWWAWDYLSDLTLIHAHGLVDQVPEADRPAVAAILPEWCRPEASAAGTKESG